jgi:hypothetical protein
VVLDPADPNVAYVAAVGNLLDRRTPSAASSRPPTQAMDKVLYVDPFTGATDLVMDPATRR